MRVNNNKLIFFFGAFELEIKFKRFKTDLVMRGDNFTTNVDLCGVNFVREEITSNKLLRFFILFSIFFY
jgi:hypothetical protein